ncbi:MAG: Lar family restriction alleviation protein [Roseovarius sp.]|uniref:Lar family restriction alleviation protein n=1 Tax=Roseovarius sp. TaxID=1486281 RepID=UPI001B3ECDD4|nr:Lar family restriction alleviation protein [Roseovarius sp.]MBQ0748577.1 Lar family restriction alleviation protein [Roseovarius sp.]MBQ0808973.1 Lar family restriction alleviation protein [Roseovarius sp.]
MTSEAPKLLPCPFCGSDDALYSEHMQGTIIHPAYRVRCDHCGASTGYTDNDHVAAWNTRDTTHTQAMVVAAYEDAAVVALSCVHLTPDPDKCIRSRVPENAQAALDALLKAERVRLLREIEAHHALALFGDVDGRDCHSFVTDIIEKETGHA